MKQSRNDSVIFSAVCLSLIMVLSASVVWGGTDVYLIYSGKHKAEKKRLIKAFPKEVSVKAYNADLLAVADYSGIQKAVAKFERAKVIVILRDRPVVLLAGATVKKDLFIVQSVKNGVSSSRWQLYLLSKGEDFSTLGEKIKKRIVSTAADLKDIEAVRASDLLLVDEKGIKMAQAVSLLVENHLSGR